MLGRQLGFAFCCSHQAWSVLGFLTSQHKSGIILQVRGTRLLCSPVPAGSELPVPPFSSCFSGGCGWGAPGALGTAVSPGQPRPCAHSAAGARAACPGLSLACLGRRKSISLLIAVLLRPDLLLLAGSNLCHLYSVPSLNLQYTFCFSSPQPLSPPSTLMQDMCGIHLGIYLKNISHPGFNTFPHQGSTKLHLNENWGIMDYPPSQTPFGPAALAVPLWHNHSH